MSEQVTTNQIVSTDSEQIDFETCNLFVTNWINVYYNKHQRYGKSLTITLNDKVIDPLHVFFSDLESFYGCKIIKHNKQGDKSYVSVKIKDDSAKYYDIDKKLVLKLNEEDIYKRNIVRLVFSVKQYNIDNKSGITLKLVQTQYKPREKQTFDCLF